MGILSQLLRPGLRWRQVSFRCLWIMLTLTCVVFAWLAHTIHEAKRQQQAWRDIWDLVDVIGFDFEVNPPKAQPDRGPTRYWFQEWVGDEMLFATPVELYLRSCPRSEHEWECLRRLTSLKNLGMQKPCITDADLEQLAGLSQLEVLALEGANIKGPGLVHLRGLSNLRELRLSVTSMTDSGMSYLKELKHLENLDLELDQITDAGVYELREMKKLKRLNLNRTQVTDVGLEYLMELPELEWLNIEWCKVTEMGILLIEYNSLGAKNSKTRRVKVVHNRGRLLDPGRSVER